MPNLKAHLPTLKLTRRKALLILLLLILTSCGANAYLHNPLQKLFIPPTPMPLEDLVPADTPDAPNGRPDLARSRAILGQMLDILNDDDTLGHDYFDAYANLLYHNRINGIEQTDLLTRSEIESLISTTSTTSTSTTTKLSDLTDLNLTGLAGDKILKYQASSGQWIIADDNSGSGGGGTTYSAGNGLTLDSTTFNLGGTLTSNVTYTTAGYNTLLTGTGKLGIGTATPTAFLDLPASTTAAASLRIRTGTQPTSGNPGDLYSDGTNLYFYNGSTWDDLTDAGSGGVTADSLDFTDFADAMTLDASTSINLYDGATDRTLRFHNSDASQDLLFLDGTTGNLGIGTTDPDEKLEVVGNIKVPQDNWIGFSDVTNILYHSGGITINPGNGNDLNVSNEAWLNSGVFIGSKTQIQALDSAAFLTIRNSNQNTQAIFNIFDQSTEVMRVDHNGLVGIGTTAPSTLLDVAGSLRATGSVALTGLASGDASDTTVLALDGSGNVELLDISAYADDNDTTYTAGTGLTLNSDTFSVTDDGLNFTQFADALTLDATTDIAITGTDYLSLTNTGTGYSFRVNDQATDTTPFVIDSTGNVGIGVSNPSYLLHVAGSGYISKIITDYAQLGYGANSNNDINAIAIGRQANGNNAGVAIGYNSTATGYSSVALGVGSSTTYDNSFALGRGTTANNTNQMLLGNSTYGLNVYIPNGSLGIGTTSPSAKLHSLATTEQLRLSYNASNYTSFTISSSGDLTIDPTGGDITLGTGDNLNISAAADLIINSIALDANSSGSSGASLIGLYDDTMIYVSTNTTVQSAIKQLDTAIASVAGSAYLQQNSGVLSQSTLTDDFALGNTTLSAPLSFDVSANNLRIGDGANDANDPTITFYASDGADSGTLSFTDNDSFYFNNSYVGIYTNNPLEMLDVRGNIAFGDNGSPNSARYITTTTTGGNLFIGREGSAGGSILTGSSPYASVLSSEGAYNLQFGTNSGTRMTLDSSGRLGIGTTAPASFLDIQGSGTSFTTQNTTDAASNQVGIFRGGNRTTPTNGDEAYLSLTLDDSTGTQNEFARINWSATDVVDASEDGSLTFQTIDSGTLNTALILRDGKVFAGGAPNTNYRTFSVYGGSSSLPGLRLIRGDSSVTAGDILGTIGADATDWESTTDEAAMIRFKANSSWDGGSKAANIEFLTKSSSNGWTDSANVRMIIDSTGLIGIGTTSPSTLLDVAGTFRATGAVALTGLATGDASDTTVLALDGSGNVELIDLSSYGTTYTAGTGLTLNADTFSVSDDGLNFTQFADSLSLDANLTLAQTSNTWTQSFTGTSTTGYTYTADSLTSGRGYNFSLDGLTTGQGMYLESTSAALTSGSLFSAYWNPTGSTEIYSTGDLFKIDVGQYGNPLNLFALYDNGSELFSVDQTKITANVPVEFNAAGDVSIANDLQFTNDTATTIKSSGPLTIESGDIYENLDLTLRPSGTGDVIVDDGHDLNLYAGQRLTLDTDDAADSYIAMDTTNDWLELWVDGGASSPAGVEIMRVKAGGDVDVDGTVNSTAFDLAEVYPALDTSIEAGDVVSVVPAEEGEGTKYKLVKATSETAGQLLGVVSTKPGFLLGGSTFYTELCQDYTQSQDNANSLRADLISQEIMTTLDKQAHEVLQIDTSTTEASTSAQNQTRINAFMQTKVEQMQTYEDILTTAQIRAIDDKLQSCAAIRQVPVALTGRVPVKLDTTAGDIKAGDWLTLSPMGAVARKATQSGWVIGRALEDSNGQNMVMMVVNITWFQASPTTIAQYDNSPWQVQTLPEQTDEILTIDKDLTITADLNVQDLAVTGTISNGFLQIDGLASTIDTLSEPLRLQSAYGSGRIEAFAGTLILNRDGSIIAQGQINAKSLALSDETRGVATVGQGSTIRIDRTWQTTPTIIQLTPSYNTRVWFTDLSKDGFTINVDPAQSGKPIHWLAIW